MTSSDAPMSAAIIALAARPLILHVEGAIDTAAPDAPQGGDRLDEAAGSACDRVGGQNKGGAGGGALG